MPKCMVNDKKCLTYCTRDLKCASKSNPGYNGDCFTWEKFRGETMNPRLHFKISTSSFQTKLFCLCTRALRGNRLHRPFHARGDRGYFHPFHLGRQHPPTVRPRFTQLVHLISFVGSPSPRSTAEPSPAPPCSPRPCACSSASSLPPLTFPTCGGPHLAIFVCSPATLEHIDAVTLTSPVARLGLH